MLREILETQVRPLLLMISPQNNWQVLSKVLAELKAHELVECINPEVRKGRLYRLTDKGDTGQGSDEEAGWKLPVDKIQTTTTLPTGVAAGYRVAIVTSSVMAIKEYDGVSWKTESLDAYSVIPLKHSGGIQMYLAKSSGPVYMGVEYGVFGKFRFMTQSAYDALSSYDSDTIYFVRSS